jgi:hypothetical protein
MSLRVTLCLSVLLLSGCVKRSRPLAKTPPQPIDPSAYVDLSPGCRLRAVTPAGSAGYETAYYLLKPRSKGQGAAITFQYATITKAGVVTRVNRPRTRLFRAASDIRFFRLVFLVRVSRSDHDMALLGTARKDTLDPWTAAILAHPESCANLRDRICSWIPEGTAVRPEVEKVQGNWTPLR